MITVELHPSFKRAYKKRVAHNRKLARQVVSRIETFYNNPDHPLLRDHSLKGTSIGLRAFSVSGDIRIIYKQTDETRVIFLDIGSHNQVY